MPAESKAAVFVSALYLRRRDSVCSVHLPDPMTHHHDASPALFCVFCAAEAAAAAEEDKDLAEVEEVEEVEEEDTLCNTR